MKSTTNVFFKLVLLSAIVLISRCSHDNSPDVKSDKSKTIPVQTTFIEKRTLINTIRITGNVEPLFSVDIYPGVNGIVTHEYVSQGDAVKKDQIIAEVLQDIPGMKFTPVRVHATVPGTITKDNIEEGDRVVTSKPLYTISQLQKVYLVGNVLETDLARLRKNEIVFVQFEAYPGLKFQGELKEISPVIDPHTAMGKVKILIDNSNDRFRLGMYGWCNVVTSFHTGLTVPLDALVHRDNQSFVFRVEYGKAREIEVKTGLIDGDVVEISGDIFEGDQVILLKQGNVRDGSLVTVVD